MAEAETKKRVVSAHIKEFENKMERTEEVPRPKPKELPNGEKHGRDLEPEPLCPEPLKASPGPLKVPQKPKLYDSMFEDRQLSEKEARRRQFLFGAPNQTAAPAAPPPPETKPNQPKVAPEKPERAERTEPKPSQPTLKTEPENVPEKKKTNCCCIL